jgi:hypothetical protein
LTPVSTHETAILSVFKNAAFSAVLDGLEADILIAETTDSCPSCVAIT